ncbi:TonB-dependent receptor [Solilutibacter silvestris]|uniref:Carboxypeptidase regulatory-like domain n=1 Tax=Solilutibacter silvestris TaxID=1645665 RepID=A0A2K1PZ11_9GAMM|nr:TonB-dependent receptor [Lysobacter silvestris]PNS08032.1 Carboxypeptidase regulatory-like domain [Lysobacter silvestris]
MLHSRHRSIRPHALALALAIGFAGNLHAQSNITGSIFGTAEAGATVVVENKDTGLTRRITADQSGRYQVSALPNGTYKVTEEKNGATIATRDNIAVNISSGTEVSFAATAKSGNELGTVTITGSGGAGIDTSQTDTRTVLSADQLNKISVARDIASVALLAPSVVANDSYKSANGVTVPSFGGSASSENAYLINGYAVTNPLTSIGFTTLPFDAIAQQQILTGGYGAEFGRSTGGVINVVSKRGSNKWKFGVYTMWAPRETRATARDRYYPVTGFYNPTTYPATPARQTDGTLDLYRKANNSWSTTVGGYVSGPIIPNKLFVYADVETTREQGQLVNSVRLDSPGSNAQLGGWRQYRNDYPRGLVKLDWNVNDKNTLEFTGVVDDAKYDTDGYSFNYADDSHGTTQYNGPLNRDRSRLYIGKYTGYLTQDMTLSVLYGQQKIKHDQDLFGYSDACPRIAAAAANRAPSVPSANYNGCQIYNAAIFMPGRQRFDNTNGGRIDFAWHLGSHDLRVGYEQQTATSYTNSQQPGGYIWNYLWQSNAGTAVDASHGVASPASGGQLGTTGYYVSRVVQTRQAEVKTVQKSQYIEDRWQIGDRFLLSLGLRNEQFTNYTAAGQPYISQKKQLAPRIGAAWDVFGDSRFKVFGNAGRYYLALPNNAAVRGAAASINTNEYFTYSGVNADGSPINPVAIAVDPSKGGVCPNSNLVSANLECGIPPNPLTTTAKNIKGHYQDEFILGFEAAVADHVSMGAKLTSRILRSAIDDTCTPALGGKCRNFNPGVGNAFYLEQPDGSLALRYFTAAELGLPKLKRTYHALDLFAEHAFFNKWYGKVEYTFSKNIGNTEGQLASDLDIGAGGQVDVSRTQDWDLPQLMVGAYGLLPNDRTHQLKAFGYYQFTSQWRAGGSMMFASGRPRSCTSFYPTADKGLYNGSYYYFCGLAGSGTPVGSTGYAPPSADYRYAPRGTYGRSPNSFQLNLNVAYIPSWAAGKLTLQADLLNALNRQNAGSYNYRYSANRTQASQTYGQELNYAAPRYLRLTARYDF